MICKHIGLLVVVTIVASSLCSADDREELISYLQLHASNWASIKRMDVLVRTDESREFAVLPGFTETTHERIILDWEANRFTYVRVRNRSTIGSDEKQESVVTGFVIKDGSFRSFLPAVRNRPPAQLTSIEQVFDDHQMPDLRISMFMKLSRGSKITWTEHKSNVFHVYPQTAKEIRALGIVDGQVQYELSSENKSRFRWRFDAEQLMPVQTKWLFEVSSDAPLMVVGTEQLQWKSIDGIFVPITIQGDFVDRQNAVPVEEMQSRISKLHAGKPTPEAISKLMKELVVDCTQYRDVRLHWVTVNKPLKDDYFDFGLIDNPDKFVLMANPVTVGASELLEQSISNR